MTVQELLDHLEDMPKYAEVHLEVNKDKPRYKAKGVDYEVDFISREPICIIHDFGE